MRGGEGVDAVGFSGEGYGGGGSRFGRGICGLVDVGRGGKACYGGGGDVLGRDFVNVVELRGKEGR